MTKENEPFELLEHLGTGGFAQTWRARVIDPDLLTEWEEEVAVKIPLTKQKERILRKELELTGSLHLQLTEMESKNIVKYLGFEIFEGKLVMVTKYIASGNLRNIMGKIGYWQRMDMKRALTIAQGILKGLSVIHQKHIVHRDIKPENILMDGEIPKIADLGIGRMIKANELASSTVGTLYYMSPELLFEETGVSFNTDIWSLGVTLYEMLCGRFPFGIGVNMPPGRVMSSIRDENVLLAFPDNAEIPPQLQTIISKALDRNPVTRYNTPDEFLRDIKKFFKGEDDSVEKELGLIQQLIHDPSRASIAEERLKELLKKFPQEPRVYLHFGEFYNRCGDYDKAIGIFKKGLENEARDSALYWGMAIAHQRKENYKSAIDSLRRAIELGLEPSMKRYAKILLSTLQRKV